LIGLLAGIILTLPAPAGSAQLATTPGELGETIFLAGACGEFGWKAELAHEPAMFKAFEAAHPEMTAADITAGAFAGAGALQTRLDAELAAVRTTVDMDAWAGAMATRCDAIAVAFPAMLSRTPETPTIWAEVKARFAKLYVPAG